MTANGRGTMRPQGRTPPFLLIGLLVVMCILGYSYWSVASTSSDQAVQIMTLQDEVRRLSTRKMEADKRSEASTDKIGALEKRNAGLLSEMQEKLQAVDSVKNELSRKVEELRNSKDELDNKGASLTKCEQDSNGIKEELQKLKEETESLKGNMDKKPAQCDQNACEEPIKNILTVLVNSLGRQQIIATLQGSGIDANKFIPAEAGQNPADQNPAGQNPAGQNQPGENLAGQNPAGQPQVQNPPQNPADQQQPLNPADQQQPQNPANQQQPQNPANQQQPQNPADPQQPQNPANQQQPPQNGADQPPLKPDQQAPQNPADQPQQGLNVVPQPNLNQDGNPGQQNVVGLKGKGGNSEHAVGVSASVNSSTMHEQGNREVPSSDGKSDRIALAKESNATTSGVQESKDTNTTGEASNGGLLKGLLTNAKRLLTNFKSLETDSNQTVRFNKTETTKAGVTTTTSGKPKEGRAEDFKEPPAGVRGFENLKETEENKTGTNGASKNDGKGPDADDNGNGVKDQKEGQDPLQNGKDKDVGNELKRVDMANNGDKDAGNQEEHKEGDDKLKFEPHGDLKEPSDLEREEDAIDRMKDNMALDDKKPEGSYKIEESEGI